jgi:hypothetical protein
VSDAELRSYLLGRLTEEEATRIEERLLEDDDLYRSLRGVEDDLFDEFARGALVAADREAFEARLGHLEDRARFAVAFDRRLETKSRSLGRPAAVWSGLAAALVAGIGAVLLLRNPTPEKAPPVIPSTPRVEPQGAIVASTLRLGTSRAEQAASEIRVPRDARSLALTVVLDPADRFDRYIMELNAPNGRSLWTGVDLPAHVREGQLSVTGTIPANLVSNGTYELAVRGVRGPSAREDLGFLEITIRRDR